MLFRAWSGFQSHSSHFCYESSLTLPLHTQRRTWGMWRTEFAETLELCPVFTPVYTWTIPAESRCGCQVVRCRKSQKLWKQAFFLLSVCVNFWESMSWPVDFVVWGYNSHDELWCVWSLTFNKLSCLYDGSLPLVESVVELWTHFMGVVYDGCACDLKIKFEFPYVVYFVLAESCMSWSESFVLNAEADWLTCI